MNTTLSKIAETLKPLPNLDAVKRHENGYYTEGGKIRALSCISLKDDTLELDAQAVDLEYLYLSGNKSLKKVVFSAALPKLTHLYLDNCALEDITMPSGCVALEHLYVQNQKKPLDKGQQKEDKQAYEKTLKKLAFEGDCPALVLLDASGNALTAFALPNGFKQLAYLYLNKNQLNNLQFTGDLPELNTLNVGDNQLTALPTEGVSYAKLERLIVKGNPLKDFEERLINGDDNGNAAEIIGLLRGFFKSGDTENYRVKLIIVGNGRIGKTCLVNRLIGEPCKDDEPYTHAISIVPLTEKHLPDVRTEKLDLKVWDFGGQEVYYATHQFFLSEEAAYIYAWTDKAIAEQNKKNDKKQSPTTVYDKWREHDYWLDNIRMHSQSSPILVIKTHCTQSRDSFPLERLDETFSLKARPLDFDAKSLEVNYLINVKKELTALVNNMPLLGSRIPNNYNDVIIGIENKKKKDETELSKRAFADIAKTAKVDDGDIEKLLSYLKLTGEIIYFPDKETLKERIFIQPQDLILQTYKLIENNDKLVKNEGLFDEAYAKTVFGWANCDVLIALLKSFYLIYEKPPKPSQGGKPENQPKKFIAPQYLPRLEDKSENDQSSFQGLKAEKQKRFVLHYRRFMPENVMINVLSEYGPYSIDAVYRNAIYFMKMNTKEGCLIECNEDERLISVYTNLNPEADAVAKDVFEKFLELSHKAEVTISVNGSDPVNCITLRNAMAHNKDIYTINNGWINDREIFSFLYAGHLEGTIKDTRPSKGKVAIEPQTSIYPPKEESEDMKGINKNLIFGGIIVIVILLLPIWKTQSGRVNILGLIEIAINPTSEPTNIEVVKPVAKKTFLKGKLRINNTKVATINDIMSVSLKDMGVNSETLDAEGGFMFKNVDVPQTNEICVEVTFPDNSILPTKTIILDTPNDRGIIQLPTISINKIDKPKGGSLSPMKDRFTINIINNNAGTIDNSRNQ